MGFTKAWLCGLFGVALFRPSDLVRQCKNSDRALVFLTRARPPPAPSPRRAPVTSSSSRRCWTSFRRRPSTASLLHPAEPRGSRNRRFQRVVKAPDAIDPAGEAGESGTWSDRRTTRTACARSLSGRSGSRAGLPSGLPARARRPELVAPAQSRGAARALHLRHLRDADGAPGRSSTRNSSARLGRGEQRRRRTVSLWGTVIESRRWLARLLRLSERDLRAEAAPRPPAPAEGQAARPRRPVEEIALGLAQSDDVPVEIVDSTRRARSSSGVEDPGRAGRRLQRVEERDRADREESAENNGRGGSGCARRCAGPRARTG